jgi:hypothetical protein
MELCIPELREECVEIYHLSIPPGRIKPVELTFL